MVGQSARLPQIMVVDDDADTVSILARHLQREWLEAFIVLVRELTDTPELRAAGVAPPSRQLMIMMLGGLRELIATTVEDGGDIGGITEVAVQATQVLLGPSRKKLLTGNVKSGHSTGAEPASGR